MRRSQNYHQTMRASSVGYIVQSMINTFAPLLFVTFQTQYEISLSQVSVLIAANFGAISVRFGDNLQAGFLFGTFFSLLMLFGLLFLKLSKKTRMLV